ncbi:hypothetical protein TWF102_008210 [Orbilia oligospora]|uniref:Peptidase A1 domain-containing protein n=1 Tax=Orbilia oligospora TaxID=2813651 RepID=A0A7C8JKC2_ORBOL|nr:hypothetical protein TWF706_001776 [Orbilia oligospora]KAF3110644.1 hypothetical protein TWF102_008210 [Orbilia oligospora]KAF3114755.1 hypothetical protein TWF103_000491 [Orbilia oligospora]
MTICKNRSPKNPTGPKFPWLAIAFSLASAGAVPDPKITERQITRVGSSTDCPVPTTTQGFQWDTKSCTNSYFAPWAFPIDKWVDPPKLNITVAGVPITATVDTGSTGLVASIGLFPNVTFTKTVPTHIFYSSSHWLEEGYEEWIDMSFGPYAMRTKILVKDKEVCCPTFDGTTDGHRCPTSKTARGCNCSPGGCRGKRDEEEDYDTKAKREVVNLPHVAYMGIGFGRGDPQNANPFLDTLTYNGQPSNGSSSSYCQGYVITHDGLHLGLNQDITKNFAWTTLPQQDVGGSRDWNTPPMVYKVDNGAQQSGAILVDTGIPNSYFTNSPITWNNGSTFEISVPGTSQLYKVKYDIIKGVNFGVVSSPNPMQPNTFGISSKAGYVNTGRKFLNCFDLAYDSIGGNFGYRYLNAAGCSHFLSLQNISRSQL